MFITGMTHFLRKKRKAVTTLSNVVLRKWNFENYVPKKHNITKVGVKGVITISKKAISKLQYCKEVRKHLTRIRRLIKIAFLNCVHIEHFFVSLNSKRIIKYHVQEQIKFLLYRP